MFFPVFVDVGRKCRKDRPIFKVIGKKRHGVYMIKEDGIIVYVGMSQYCVLERCYRHFYTWSARKHFRGKYHFLTYYDKLNEHDYEVAILETAKEQAQLLEQAMILIMKPRDNIMQYESKAQMNFDFLENAANLIIKENGDRNDFPF